MRAYEWLEAEHRRIMEEREKRGGEWWTTMFDEHDEEFKRIRKEYQKRLRRETWADIWKLMWDADKRGLRTCYMFWWAGVLLMIVKFLPWPHTTSLQDSVWGLLQFACILPLLIYAIADMHRLQKKWRQQEKEWREKYKNNNSSLGGE